MGRGRTDRPQSALAASRARSRAQELADATPATRNRYIDLLRVLSIAVVVLGHWNLAVLTYHDGFHGENLLDADLSLRILTWFFQVMPVFFIVGGFASGGSWESAVRRGVGYGEWLRGRGVRLLRPGLVFVAFWAVLPPLAVLVGLAPSIARLGGREVALPLWFLGNYVAMMIFVPPLVWAHGRYRVWTFAGIALAVTLLDVARYGSASGWVGAALGAPNYVLVWLAILELGLCWRDGLLRARRWLPWAMIGAGVSALAILTLFFNYPVSMLHLTSETRSNAMPPNLAMLALGLWQCGAVLLFEDIGNRWLQRGRVWLDVVVANSMIMTLYLWNMTALVLAAVLLLPTGIFPQPEPTSAEWWLLRPLWLLACAVCLFPFAMGFRWAERPRPIPARIPGPANTAAALIGTTSAAVGFGILAASAFPVPGEASGPQLVGVGLVAAGAGLLRVTYPRRERGGSDA